MKKVIALALALVMVCTMALAVTVNVGGDDAYAAAPGTYGQLAPGSVLYFTLSDLAGTTGFYVNDKLEFVPANNKVVVTYGKGAELVKSAGWVQVAADKKAATSWQYQIALKDNDAATYEGKVADFSITKVTFKATGETINEYFYDGQTTKANHFAKYEKDYGYATAEYVLDKATLAAATGLNSEFTAEDVIYTVVAGTDEKGDPLKTGSIKLVAGNDDVTYVLSAGQKVLRKSNVATIDTATLVEKNGYNAALDQGYTVVNDTNLVGTTTVTNWNTKWNAYAVAADGKTVTKVPVVIDDGVATIKVPAYSSGIVYQGTLKNVAASAAEAPEVTNPGTGANDVVGVAAALAVVALVSGAAISLKK